MAPVCEATPLLQRHLPSSTNPAIREPYFGPPCPDWISPAIDKSASRTRLQSTMAARRSGKEPVASEAQGAGGHQEADQNQQPVTGDET